MRALFVFFVLFQTAYLLGQDLNRKTIYDWIEMCNSSIDMATRDKLFIIDGVPFNSENEVDSILNQIDVERQKVIIDYFDPSSDSIETTFWDNHNLIAIIISKNDKKIKRREISASFNKIKLRFVSNISDDFTLVSDFSEFPVLFVNNKRINNSDAKNFIENINVRSITHLATAVHAPSSIFGENAKNGLVKIWTK